MDETTRTIRTVAIQHSAIAEATANFNAGELLPTGYAKMMESIRLYPPVPTALAMAASAGVTASVKSFLDGYTAVSGVAKFHDAMRSATMLPGVQEMLASQRESVMSPGLQAAIKAFNDQKLVAAKLPPFTGVSDMLRTIEGQSRVGFMPGWAKGLERFATPVPVVGLAPVATATPLTRTPIRLPVRGREDVRRFLVRRHPALLRKLDGIYEAIDLSDGVSQSACSAAELLKLLIFSLVTHADVRTYARNTYGTKPLKHHALEWISIVYTVDVTILMTLTSGGGLSDRFQDLKHDEWKIDRTRAREQLLDLIDQLEDFLVFLAQSITS